MCEAENAVEVPAFDHLGSRHRPVALLSPEDVGPEQAAEGVIGKEAVPSGDGKMRGAGQMDPIEVTHQREMVRGRRERQFFGEFPRSVAGLGETKLAFNLDWLDRACILVDPKQHTHSQVIEFGELLVLLQIGEVPLIVLFTTFLEIAGIRAFDRERTKIRTALEFERHHRRVKQLSVPLCINLP